MGEVFRDCGEEPLRFIVAEAGTTLAQCQATVVHARRGRHLSIPYGPVFAAVGQNERAHVFHALSKALQDAATQYHCSFIRMSPFIGENEWQAVDGRLLRSPHHLLAEQIWYVPLCDPDPWQSGGKSEEHPRKRTEDALLTSMRKTTRNLVRRSEKEGIEVRASVRPMEDLDAFLALHEHTRLRHKFTPYTERLFRAQIHHFAPRKELTLYLARHKGTLLAASIHMHAMGETSYHHGASIVSPLPASYALQWRAITDALKRGDHIYSFWGIAPGGFEEGRYTVKDPRHPFAGVTLFKTGFGGRLLPLIHCMDLPLRSSYAITRVFETLRKWKRGF
jgi:lipid II:glycine glycyltransferase (peptidoglycan interpeptide bridge formation enzyme)